MAKNSRVKGLKVRKTSREIMVRGVNRNEGFRRVYIGLKRVHVGHHVPCTSRIWLTKVTCRSLHGATCQASGGVSMSVAHVVCAYAAARGKICIRRNS